MNTYWTEYTSNPHTRFTLNIPHLDKGELLAHTLGEKGVYVRILTTGRVEAGTFEGVKRQFGEAVMTPVNHTNFSSFDEAFTYVKNRAAMTFGSNGDNAIMNRGFLKFRDVDHMIDYLDDKGVFARKKTSFLGFYISDYCLDYLYNFITAQEAKVLKRYQQKRLKECKEHDESREWKLTNVTYFMDNSIEEIWTDKNGETKTVLAEGAHGDVC